MAEFFDDADVAQLVAGLGRRTATYTPYGGSPVSVSVLFEPGGEQISVETGEVFQASDQAVFLRSEVSSPAKDAAIVFDDADLSGTYLVGATVEKDDATVVVEVRK